MVVLHNPAPRGRFSVTFLLWQDGIASRVVFKESTYSSNPRTSVMLKTSERVSIDIKWAGHYFHSWL